jgi:anthranilate/para-aminobenzoate synthase component I
MHVLPLGSMRSPTEVALALAHLPGLCWLDGDSAHADGRFSFVAAAPVELVEETIASPAPLAAFDRLELPPRAASHTQLEGLSECDVPHWIGYVAYDACIAGGAQRLLRAPQRRVLSFARYEALIAFDHVRHRSFLLGDDRAACERLHAQLERRGRAVLSARSGAVLAASPDQHRQAIARALQHIAAGDVYQVNLARAWDAAFEGAPLALFCAMRAASAVPFGFYYDDGARAVLARTMECFLRWERASRQLRTRPIKGTLARRGDRDLEEAAALQCDDKERAEHAMIVDLMRNDLGRVAEVGSVSVPEVMAVEPYAKLSHLVSTVACRTRAEVSLRQVLEATFPPGSITGAPKLRAIELIEQLESVARDVYTGALGFVDRTGGLSLAVAIRTAIAQPGSVRYFAGGGIVEASLPERELAETELKARVFLDALQALPLAEAQHALSSNAVLR